MLPKGAGTPTVVTHMGGSKFSIRIRSHEIVVDQTLKGGGEDSAPTPIELLGASLGSCIGYYVNQFLTTRDLPTDGMRVEVTQVRASSPSRIESFSVSLVLPEGIPEHHMPVIERVIHTCPAHNTLLSGATVRVAIETPSAELASTGCEAE